MMFNFKNFLNESYKSELLENEALVLFNDHCKNANIKYPIIRGMRGDSDYYVFEGNKGNRTTLSAGYFHNIFIDENIKNGNINCPLRSKSIIGISGNTQHSLKTAKYFGKDLYAIFPYDDTIVAVCSDDDILESKFKESISYSFDTINSFGSVLRDAIFGQYVEPDKIYTSVNQVVKDIFDVCSSDNDGNIMISRVKAMFDDCNENVIKEKLLKQYSLENIGVHTIYNSELKNNLEKEVWVGGKCLAIKYDIYKKMINHRDD